MRYRTLGKSGIRVSEVSLGCWTLGGPNWANGTPNGWAEVDEAEVKLALDHALERGVNHFDNADVYGNGRAERLLGRLLGPRKNDVVIATKVGHFPGTAAHAYEPRHVRNQCEQSLRNLGRDYIDLYYFHHGDFGPGDAYLDDAVAVLEELKREGKIRLVGQSAYSSDDFVRVVPKVRPDVLQSWAHAMDTRFLDEGSPVRGLLDESGMSFVAFSPLARGLLLGKYKPGKTPEFEPGDHRRDDSRFSEPELRVVDTKLGRLRDRFGGEPTALGRAALGYVLSYAPVACVIPGFRNLAQVRMNLDAAERPLDAEDVAYVRRAMAD